MTFGEILKQLRESRNLTQQDLADILNIGRPTIAGYETKNKQPDYEKLTKLADYFNVTIDYLLGRSEDKTPSDSLSKSSIKLTIKEQEKLDKEATDLVNDVVASLSKNKEYLEDKDYEVLQAGFRTLLETMTLKNKEKYTPKIYKKNKK